MWLERVSKNFSFACKPVADNVSDLVIHIVVNEMHLAVPNGLKWGVLYYRSTA